jgi:meiotic recombination protein SPO11
LRIEVGQGRAARRRGAQLRAVRREVRSLLLAGCKMTQRGLWYRLKTIRHEGTLLFSSPASVSACVFAVCRAISDQCGVPCPREALGITAAPRSSMTGCVTLLLQATAVTAAQATSLDAIVWQVPGDTEAVRALRFCPHSRALCVLVVEKDSVFRRLVDDRFVERVPCMLVTACGFPDVATRTLVGAVVNSLRIPAFALTDYNPHGLSVMLSYKFGSARLALEARACCPSVHWIGLHAADVGAATVEDDDASGLPPDVFQPFTPLDRALCAGLRCRPCVARSPVLLAEVGAMEERQCKVEIEALACRGFGALGTLLERKICKILCEASQAAYVLQNAIRRWLAKIHRPFGLFKIVEELEALSASAFEAWCASARARGL